MIGSQVMADTNQTETRVCKLCAETIKAAAVVCPHCRSWQKRWSWTDPRTTALLMAAFWILVMVGMGVFFERVFGDKDDFATYRDDIVIVESQVSQRPSGTNTYVTVVGTLTNASAVSWKDVGVEAQFLDSAGKPFDAITVNAEGFRGVVVLPHGGSTFKIEGRAARPGADYSNYRVTVRWAKDVRALF